MIPFDLSSEAIIVHGVLSGPLGITRRVMLLVDSGTPHTVIDAPVADSVGFGAGTGVGRSSLLGVTGVSDGYIVRAPRLRAIDHIVTDYPIAVHDLPDDMGFDGLLGLDFFHGCRLVVDFVAQTIEVDKVR